MADAARLGIDPIDLVVVNLYPFEATIARAGAMPEECIEQIDIGGPSMIRSAAKNHASVTVLTDPSQYPGFLEKLAQGAWTLEDRKACALAAFQRTAAYDATISAWMAEGSAQTDTLPERLGLGLEVAQVLRYGENPHQLAGFYVRPGARSRGLPRLPPAPGQGAELQQPAGHGHGGPGRCSSSPRRPAVIVKHNNPCGVGRGSHVLEAFHKAQAGDPAAAFGGIVAFNRPVGVEVAQAMVQTFWEVILAPGFSPEALALFAARKQVRILETPGAWPLVRPGPGPAHHRRRLPGAAARQPRTPVEQWQVKATGRGPWPLVEDMVLADTVARAVKSNAIVLVQGRRHGGHRRRPDEPDGFGGDRLPQGRRPRPGGDPGLRRLLPLRGRAGLAGPQRGGRHHRAGRLPARQGRHRGRPEAGRLAVLHRHPAFPPLAVLCSPPESMNP